MTIVIKWFQTFAILQRLHTIKRRFIIHEKARLTLSSVVEEVVFGVEDSLVSTLGTLTGIAIGTQSMFAVVLSGVVLIFAEAVSMMAGSYLSSKAESEVWLQHHAREWNELAKQISTRPLEAVLRRQNISGMDRSDVLEASCIQQQRLAKHILQRRALAIAVRRQASYTRGRHYGVSYLLPVSFRSCRISFGMYARPSFRPSLSRVLRSFSWCGESAYYADESLARGG